jgi:asparagine synthetase B (glutamine-hydrolysing)
MCGIYGEIHFQGDLDVRAATARLQMLAHRGPDGWGVSAGNLQSGHIETLHNPRGMPMNQVNLFLGHRRLSIIDLSDLALQPTRHYRSAVSGVVGGDSPR